MAGGRVRSRWRPAVEAAAERFRFTPRTSDRYAVVDDIEAGRAVLVSSPWPDVDDQGHLIFADEATSRDLALAILQAAVDSQRQAAGQPAPDRPLRIGDVFWVRIPARASGEDPGRWRIVDVTRAARRCAHAALLVAASPALRLDQPAPVAEPMGMIAAADEPAQPAAGTPPPAGAAQAAV